jgi:uncharacterized membrane protein YgdD (TMEM256/DUF423 family)
LAAELIAAGDFVIAQRRGWPNVERLQALTNSVALRTAALLGFLGVALGAFGAHALKQVLAQNQTTAIWEKAVFYHFIHAVMLFVLAQRSLVPTGPWLSFLLGIFLFCGSLYVFALTRLSWLPVLTPFGGVSFLIGWLWLVFAPGAARGG